MEKQLSDMAVGYRKRCGNRDDAPLGDPVEFLLKGYNLTLGREGAKNVWLELED